MKPIDNSCDSLPQQPSTMIETKRSRTVCGVFWRVWSLHSGQVRPSFFVLLAVGILLMFGTEAFGKSSVLVNLTAKDGSTHISGRLLNINGNKYHVETEIFGTVSVKVDDFECHGLVCPDLLETAIIKAKMEARTKQEYKVKEKEKNTEKAPVITISTKNAIINPKRFYLPEKGTQTERLLAVIAIAEATQLGYDTVQLRARIKPPNKPTQMTLGQIKKWVRDTPKQQHAIGRYQFIPKTFNSLQRRLGLSDRTRFSPDIQDKMAIALLKDAGYNEFLEGEIGVNRFMDRLAAIWAGLPLQSGRSKYHGYAGNKATISRAYFSKYMKQIFFEPKSKGHRG